MEAFLVSTMVVGLAEIGDKTQILSLMLGARFQRPLPIIFGILFATLANHAVAGLAGTLFGSSFAGPWMRWILGISFLSVAVWALFPDKYKGNATAISRSGAFVSTLVAFFLAEIGPRGPLRSLLRGRRGHHARHDASQYSGRDPRRPDRGQAARQSDPHHGGRRVRGAWSYHLDWHGDHKGASARLRLDIQQEKRSAMSRGAWRFRVESTAWRG
jgi:hypothetical protein